jgi:AraC family transcriptional regulator
MLVQNLPATRATGARPIDPGANREESAVFCVRGCVHEAHFRDHLLAVRWVRGGREHGGREHVALGSRCLMLDDETYLFVNEGRSYDVRLASASPMQSFTVYFRRGLAADVLASLDAPLDALLEAETAPALYPVIFDEHLQSHDSLVSPVLRFIERHLDLGVTEPAWYEEQLVFLLERMFRKEVDIARREAAVGAVRRATRREVVRRVALATDYIHSCYERPIMLADMGAAAALSPHHLLRLFKLVNGCTPREYLQAKRTRMAARLIATTELRLEEIAHRVGFEDRSTLGRQLRRTFGKNPRQMRTPRAASTSAALTQSTRLPAPQASLQSTALPKSGATFEVLATE